MIHLAVSLTFPRSDSPCCVTDSSQKWFALLCHWQFPEVILAVSLAVPRSDSPCCVTDSSRRLWALCWGHWRVWRRGASRPTTRYTMSQTATTTMHNWRSAWHIVLCVCVCVYVCFCMCVCVGGGASSRDESLVLHNGNCIALFSASSQTLWTLVICCCCWSFVTLN